MNHNLNCDINMQVGGHHLHCDCICHTIVGKLIIAKIVDNEFHASGMLNVLECVKLDTDEQRLDRCRLYLAWQKYFAGAKVFTNKTNAKKQARKNAIAGIAVPEIPLDELFADDYSKQYEAQRMSDAEIREAE